MAYATQDDVYIFIHFFRLDYRKQDVNTTVLANAEADINGELLKKGYTLPVTDVADLLKFATIALYMQLSGLLGEIENVIGVVKERTLGNQTTRYENNLGMFFFASGGGSGNFQELLANETWRMRAFRLVKAWTIQQFATNNDGLGAGPQYENDTAWL